MKFIVFLILLFVSDVHSMNVRADSLRESRRAESKVLTYLKKPENPFVKALEDKFNAFGTTLENSKFFNFVAGAALKAFSLLEGNVIGDLIKCVVTSIEVFYNSVKFPAKTLDEVKAMSKGLSDAAVKDALKDSEAGDGTDDAAVQGELKDGHANSHEIDCQATGEVIKEEGGIDFIDDVGTEEAADAPKFSQVEGEAVVVLPKIFKKLKEKFKGLKNKFAGVVEKFKAKLAKLEETVKKWLAKPIVKSVISFLECSLPNILTLIVKGGASFVGMFTGISLINIVKQGPKFLKMIIDGIKSIRTGFTKNSIKEKYMEYGKGTASLIMVVILTAIPQ